MIEPEFRAEQTLFLSIPQCEQDRPSRRRFQFSECLGDGEESRRAAGVVVRAVVDEADRSVTVAAIAIADVVIMGADDDNLRFKFGVGSFNLCQDVSAAGVERLIIGLVGGAAGETEILKLLSEISARRAAAA